ncbi:MAG: superoxide dismutase [Polyangia bacterium]|jgi:Fe-Mn family superoxide dismutase|nr:superoxide dismutase [Polyangia bacterium]
MPFELPPLPWDKSALEPHISARTFDFHHGKHHAAYVNNLNGLIAGTELADKPLEEIIRLTAADASRKGVFNNAAQVWNHSFFWSSMTPGGGKAPSGDLAALIDASFGGLDGFKEAFKKAAVGQFGSGWAWLISVGGKLEIRATANADTPLTQGVLPLLTCDVWEHAYYLDYQNRRPDFVQAFLDHLVSWDFAARNLAA